MIVVYIFFLLFQLFNTYLSILTPLNPYIFSVLFIFIGFKKKIHIINLKLLATLLFIVVAFIIIYSCKFSILSSFTITAKAVQFNFGYLLLIPGFSVIFSYLKIVKLEDILRITFWVISTELLLEFVLIRVLGVSPGSFAHYPKVQHITLDQVTGLYTADRLLGLAGNASVTGVLYASSFILYLGHLYKTQATLKSKKSIVVIATFIVCFFMIVSGSAFFAILLAGAILWIQGKGNMIKNLLLASIVLGIVLLTFNFLSTLTDAFGNKFTTEYLFLLVNNDDIEGSLPYLLSDMSKGYHWYNFFIGSYFFEWGNAEARAKTVDYFYVNVIYEFGLIGLTVFFYVIKQAYNALKKSTVINYNYFKLGFLTIVLGSLHYPVISYMATQVFLSALAAIAIRDSGLKRQLLSNL